MLQNDQTIKDSGLVVKGATVVGTEKETNAIVTHALLAVENHNKIVGTYTTPEGIRGCEVFYV